MTTLLLRKAAFLATFDDAGCTYQDAAVLIRDNVIEQLGRSVDVPGEADYTLDASNLILLPGLVNTHHHFYQTLTRNVPGTQNAGLFDWLTALYPIWGRMTPQAIAVSTMTAMAELMLTGCTSTSDHCYIWPNGARIDDQIEAARVMGMRFHAARGSMSVGQSRGGLPPDSIVEDEGVILRDSQRAIDAYHDAARFSMTRIVLAPCSPFSVSADLMRETVALARANNVHSHTHLAETMDEERFCTKRFGRRPVELAADLGWTGEDVWHAHAVCSSDADAAVLGRTHTGIAHCPTSNLRLGSGIAPIARLARAGARIGLGVDGSASNDASSMLDEARQALLLARAGGDPSAMTATTALSFATRGGARVLGRDDIGMLAPGMAADVVGYRIDTLPLAGAAVHDPIASLLFCRPGNVDLSIINGRQRIRDGKFVDLDLDGLIERHNRIARALVRDELR